MSGNASRAVCDLILFACCQRRQIHTERHLILVGVVKALAGSTRDVKVNAGQLCDAIRVHFNTALDAGRRIAAAFHSQIAVRLDTNHISLFGGVRRIVIDYHVCTGNPQVNGVNVIARGNAPIIFTCRVNDQLAVAVSRNCHIAAVVLPYAGHSVIRDVNCIRTAKHDHKIWDRALNRSH